MFSGGGRDAQESLSESIKELPGVAADPTFLEEIEAKYGYFSALKYVYPATKIRSMLTYS